MSKLEEFHAEVDAFRQNQMLFRWLRDDGLRAEFYGELSQAGFPVLRLKSLVRPEDSSSRWPSEDLYLVSSRQDVAVALSEASVQPYSQLDSGGLFMLGIDDPRTHGPQHDLAAKALTFSSKEIEATVCEAVRIALVRPLKKPTFDLVVDVAQQAALRFVELLFGLPAQAHVELELGLVPTYERLSYQIVGRQFVSDTGLVPTQAQGAQQLRTDLEGYVKTASTAARDPELMRKGLSGDTVIRRLYRTAPDPGEAVVVALGLMAGTIGNITAAIAIAIHHFFETRAQGEPLIDEAIAVARAGDRAGLEQLIGDALSKNPPAPFLTRIGPTGGVRLPGTGVQGGVPPTLVPNGGLMLIALGADPDPDLQFGGDWGDPLFPHRCVGRYLAMPLIHETVRQVLLLPGLGRVVDPATGKAQPLVKAWGAICQTFPLQFKLGRRLNHQPLHVVLPIKEPTGINAALLEDVISAGAYIVEDALASSRHVHCAWFNIDRERKNLSMSTMYDGDFDSYVEFFALLVPLFDIQFQYLDVPGLPRPIRDYPIEFVTAIREYNQAPVADYFYSAYPLTTVADIENAGLK